ncbi:MAG: PaaI family thioesterase [Methanocorpusculum sp.]|uniref:PaaI family thioesterase n=1 Tax=Methanocorpusculum petauri TaxID=3002863 RepID=A0ABT4IEF7_9EURY|nr:PaaI family thioesterase [Methanocorpusculum petauri]MDE2443754.1 PaaI family thioesterase [Methanocorpusculum sp.]MCZ0860120.1 PaaI family thioesterase [Methanocorpusculum petauri]MDE2519313.1 PaaI family thioesterase [Methanocorpusculum sp.]MDE2523386.1 PaaI family thioesterase [Methanocorpusculum sp.]MDE2524934.1 PaaI family thioesterase [Methanocorpusculum sp.]
MHPYVEKIASIGSKANPTFQTLGIEPVSWGEGKAVLKMTVTPALHNGVGFLQGGFYVILADEAIALAILAVAGDEEGTATISETTSFLRGVCEGEIYGVATIIRKGRRIVFAEGEVRKGSPDGELLSRTVVSYTMTKA